MARHDRSDAVIVGAGPAAAVAGLALAAAGWRVTCLEQGDWPDRSTFGGDTPFGELIGMKRWSSRPGIRGGAADYPIDDHGSDMAVLNWSGVGGGAVLYNAQWPRLHPSDFRARSTDGVGADWPLTYGELQPYYEETDRQFGVSGLGGNPAYPDGVDPPLPPLPIGAPGLSVARAHARLGWHWWPDNNAILSAPQDGRHACVQRGTCGRGCDEGAKASPDLTHWPQFIRHGGTLVTQATVRRILVDRQDRVTGVEWVDSGGTTHVHEADVVLLAANGIGTPRLLLASANARHPDGLANDSGLLGRGLMLHPMALVSGVLADGPPWYGHNGGLINSMQFYVSDPSRGFVRGARWALTASAPPLATALGPHVGWGAEHHRQMREQVGHRVTWVLLAEDLPDDHNTVTLTDAHDRAGLAGVAIHYRISDNTDRLLDWHAGKAIESLTEAGARDISVTRARANGHLMGTARMGLDPAASVCDRWGFTHRIPNLGILDGSVFPTAGGMNPTSTICALALRAARRLIEHGSAGGARPPAASRPAPATFVAGPTMPVRASLPPPAATNVGPAERALLARWADELIPAADGMPAASAAGVSGELLDHVLRVREDLAEPLVRVLREPAHADLTVRQLKDKDRGAFATIGVIVAGSYYASADVRERLQWRSDLGRPLETAAFPPYIAEGLLDHLLDTNLA